MNRHPEYGLPLDRPLRIDGKRFTYNAYLDCWEDGLGIELTGWAIMHGMSTTLRVEVEW